MIIIPISKISLKTYRHIIVIGKGLPRSQYVQ